MPDGAAPGRFAPMKAVAGPLPGDDEAWAHEVKWDGARVLAAVTPAGLALTSANGHDVTDRYPELADLARALPAGAVIDGEVVALDDTGRPSFSRLQRRLHRSDPSPATVAEVPVTYAVFDLLALDGRDARPLPYDDRRRLLAELVEPGPAWSVPAALPGTGAEALAAVRERGLEGLVCKRRTSPYRSGRRSPDWVKVKLRRHQEVVVVGWLPGEGGLAGRLGSLAVGVHGSDGLVWAGRVGSGIDEAERAVLVDLLAPLARADAPLAVPPPPAQARLVRWVEPRLVVEVAYAEWSPDGVLRHPSYLGRRDDVDPAGVVREPDIGSGMAAPAAVGREDRGVAAALSEDQVGLSLPADPAYGRLVRIAASALALRLRMSFPAVADLRLALDETVILLLHPTVGADDLEVVLTSEPETLQVEAWVTGATGAPPSEAVERFDQLVEHLVAEAEVLDGAHRVRLRCERAELTPQRRR